MNTNERRNQNRAFIATTLILTAIAIWLSFTTLQLGNRNKALETSVDSLSLINEEISELLATSKAEVKRYKTEVNSKDSMILVYQKMVRKREQRIKKITNQNKSSLKASKKELASLKKFTADINHKIKLLEERNAALEAQNKDLSHENEELENKIRELEEKLGILSAKVEKGSVLKITNLSIVTEKKDKTGNFVVVKKAKRADRLSIHFDINENQVADQGAKLIYIRIFDPKGKLIEGGAAGTFTNSDGNVEIPYTRKEEINFANNKQKIAVPVLLNDTEPTKGDYKIEVYIDGNFSGADQIKLK